MSLGQPAWPTETALVVSAPGPGPGHWAGAPSAVVDGDLTYLAYRLRRPVEEGRGHGNVLARSTDGVTFETVGVLAKETFGAESLERPALVRAEDGRWRLYVSCATPGTKHWRVDLLEADTIEGLATAVPRTTLTGDATYGVKDPVLLRHRGVWHLWASCHPLEDPDATDRMTTEHATSEDGMGWTWHGTALAGRPGRWDARGVRISSVWFDGTTPMALYDGRASAAENWEERTGLAVGADVGLGRFEAVGEAPVAESSYAGNGLRYVSVVEVGGVHRAYYEVARPDGAHELRMAVLPRFHVPVAPG
ncbi:MAG TPA: hypothetical protein VMI11_09015 [Actinomycetes bacterium]|nr:hypothetical protein [Actinomycetes bacterium]